MIGFIYKLTDNSDKVYYGSTIKSLKKRLIGHKTPSNGCRSNIMDRDSMKIECIEEFNHHLDFILKELLTKRESYYIKNNECINLVIPGRTKKEFRTEYCEKNKERIAFKRKEYNEKNSLKRNEKINCECGSKYTHNNKSTHFKTKKHQKFINI